MKGIRIACRLILCLTASWNACFAQSMVKLSFLDSSTHENIPFVKVYSSSGYVVLADLDGQTQWPTNELITLVKANGYKTVSLRLSMHRDTTLYLSPLLHQLVEVKVKPGLNPALRIIQAASKNRNKNHPVGNFPFQYDAYSKFYFQLDDEILKNISPNSTDSSLIRLKRSMQEHYLFLIETVSQRTFHPPAQDKEIITHSRVSGLNDPLFSNVTNELQAFSFYDEAFRLLGKAYVNPLSDVGLKKYWFSLVDTTIIGSDSTFTINYYPKKEQRLNALKGQLFINTAGFAIEKVTASPCSDTATMKISIVQEYQRLPEGRWFPEKLSTEVSLTNLMTLPGVGKISIIGKGNTYLSSVQTGSVVARLKNYDGTLVEASDEATNVTDAEWDSVRVHRLTKKEETTYLRVDSIAKVAKLQGTLNAIKALATGKIPLGYLSADLMRLLDFNQVEKYRLGLGLETSEKLSKRFTLGGYAAFGTGDKIWKYGGFGKVILSRRREWQLFMQFKNDVMERGGPGWHRVESVFDTRLTIRNFYVSSMDDQRLAEIGTSLRPRADILLVCLTSYRRIFFRDGYSFSINNPSSAPFFKLDYAESSLQIYWHPGERDVKLGSQRIVYPSRWPKIHAMYTHAWKGVAESSLSFSRWLIEMEHRVRVGWLGRFEYQLSAGLLTGKAPLSFAFNGNASGLAWNVYAPYTFQTMRPLQFYHTSYFSCIAVFEFPVISTPLEWFNPQFAIHHAILYGTIDKKILVDNGLAAAEKGYFECGLALNRIYGTRTMGLGAGVYYAYGYYAMLDCRKNIVPKITFSVSM